MRLHVVSVAHTQTTDDYLSCAYTQKVVKFCKMMKARGHTVFLYSGTDNTAECTEHTPCISETERALHVGDGHYTSPNWNPKTPAWFTFNQRAISAIRKRVKPHDFICVIGGTAHEDIGKAFPKHLVVEFGIGYAGTFARYRVFESYAWMHAVYGQQQGAMTANGNFYNTVIPNFFDTDDFPFAAKKDDYYLYLGRFTQRKGVQIACDACKRLGVPLKLAGFGDYKPTYGEVVGEVGKVARGKLMSKAKAVFVPTQYLEPFGGVAVEAMMCGTPVITTDWGAFTETVRQGVTGYRCYSLSDFCAAANDVEKLKPRTIAAITRDNYSLETVGAMYENYFARLETLWDKGWYS